MKALIEGARLLRTIPQSDLERIVAEFEAEFTEGAGLLDSADRMDTILNESLSPEEDERHHGRQEVRGRAGKPAADLARTREARAGTARHLPGWRTSADRGHGAVEAGAADGGERPVDNDEADARRNHQAHGDDGECSGRRQQDRRGPLALQRADGNLDQGHIGRTGPRRQRAQRTGQAAARGGHAGSRAAGTPDLDGVRARLFAFDDLPLLTQKARVLLFDGLSTELVTLALRGASAALAEAVLSAIGARRGA